MEGLRTSNEATLKGLAFANSSPDTFTVLQCFSEPTFTSRRSVSREALVSGSWLNWRPDHDDPSDGSSEAPIRPSMHIVVLDYHEEPDSDFYWDISLEDFLSALDTLEIDANARYFQGKSFWWGFAPFGIRNGKRQTFLLKLWGRNYCIWSYDPEKMLTRGILLSDEVHGLFEDVLLQFRSGSAHPLFPGFVHTVCILDKCARGVVSRFGRLTDIQDKVVAVVDPEDEPESDGAPALTELSGIVGSLASFTLEYHRVYSHIERFMDALITDSLGFRMKLSGGDSGKQLEAVWDEMAEVTELLKLQLQNLVLQTRELETTSSVLLNIIYNLIAKEDSNASRSLAEAARNDSASMKTVAIMTMAFLPATFFAALFAMPAFDWDGSPVVQDHFWVYLAFTLPSTALVFILWAVITRTQRTAILEAFSTLKVTKLREKFRALKIRRGGKEESKSQAETETESRDDAV